MQHFEVQHLDFDRLSEVALTIVSISKETRVITFQGDLGAGKTTLIKAICKALEVRLPVNSPTFTLINEYSTSSGAPVYHIDMYRLNNERDALELGIDDYTHSGHWCLIEWPEKIAPWLPENFVSLKIEVDPLTHARRITLRHSDE